MILTDLQRSVVDRIRAVGPNRVPEPEPVPMSVEDRAEMQAATLARVTPVRIRAVLAAVAEIRSIGGSVTAVARRHGCNPSSVYARLRRETRR